MRGAQKILVCPLAKQQDGQEGERKVSFQKKKKKKTPPSPCRFKVHTYGFGVLGGVGGCVWSARPWLSLRNVPIGQFEFIHSLL